MTAAKPKMLFPRRWAYFAAGILLTHFSLMMLAVTVYVRTGTGDVIPDYYEKAVRWDEQKAATAKAAAQPAGAGSEVR